MVSQREHVISKEDLLKNLRSSLMVSKENPFENIDLSTDVYLRNDDILELIFAQNLNKAGGSFVYCDTLNDFQSEFSELVKSKNWTKFRTDSKETLEFLDLNPKVFAPLSDSSGEEISITRCEFLAARTGSVIMSSSISPDRLSWTYCKAHIIVASPLQVVSDLTQAYAKLKDKYKNDFPSLISVVSGPSRTTDIEFKKIIGAQGPSEVWVFMVENL